jgi:hypothetical protein
MFVPYIFVLIFVTEINSCVKYLKFIKYLFLRTFSDA